MSSSCPYTLEKIQSAVVKRGHKFFQGEYNINLVGIRTDDNASNAFNDWITLSHLRNNGTWAFYAFQATTDPGVYYRENPANVKGTAVLPPGQHSSMWTIGKHQGKYDALVQATPVTVWRDADQDELIEAGPEDEGWHGINCHRANAEQASSQVDKWSAGCQVFADPHDFDFLLTLCCKQVSQNGWETFTYTLLEEKDL